MAILAVSAADGKTATLIANEGETLARAIWLSGLLPPRSMCAGLALCGKCRLKYVSPAPEPAEKDRLFFSAEEIADGWRLGCQHLVPANAPLETSFLHVQIADSFIQPVKPEDGNSDSQARPVYLGIDLGTTTMEWQANDAAGEKAAGGQFPNPQGASGADVISRLEYARVPAHRQQLSRLATDAILEIAKSLRDMGLRTESACLAANPAMTEILLERDIEGLCQAPAWLDFTGSEILPFPADKPVMDMIFPPFAGPFLGGDTSCGLLALIEEECPRPFFLADLGTNAELALLTESGALFMTSVPLGPALEGIGPLCGQGAGPGVCASFSLSPAGLVPEYLPGACPGAGICATGYLALLRVLFGLGLLDRHGHFLKPENAQNPLARQIASGLSAKNSETVLKLPDNLFLASSDIEQILKVRAALFVGIRQLLKKSGLAPGQIAAWRIAGALGSLATQKDLELLGFPANLNAGRIKACGNLALAGACILARQPAKMEPLKDLLQDAAIIELNSEPDFHADFLDAMQWQ